MNSNDERSIISVDADMIIGGCRTQGDNVASVLNNFSRSTIKIDSLCIKLGIVKEKGDAQKCRHFSIRGYVAEMREKGRSNFLPFTEPLPPIDVPNFRYWLCQRCLQNCGTANASHAALTSVCDQSMVRPCGNSNPQQDCDRKTVLPFGEGTSGVKRVDSRNDDENVLAALGPNENESQSSEEIPAKAAVPQEPTKHCSIDTNFEANAGVSGKKESNGLREYEDSQKSSIVKETVTTLVDQQNDYPNGPPRRKARKVRLLKELLSGKTENLQQKKENSALRLGPRASSPLAASSQIKRKMLHDQVQDQRSVDKKAKASKGNAVAKTSVVEHSRDPGAGECEQETNKYQWHKHGTQRSSIVDKVGSDPVTAWRSIFSDMGRENNQVAAASGASRPTYDFSKGRGTEPYSNLMAPPQPDKNSNVSKKMSIRNPLKSKFFEEDSRKINVGGSRAKDSQSDTELGLGLSLNHDPQTHVRPLPSRLNRTPSQDHSRRTGFFMGEGESSIAHRIPSDSRLKEGYVHDVSNRHAPRTALLQEQRPYTQLPYGSCSGHQKLDFSDPYKRNTGVRVYSDLTRPRNHERQEKMFSIGRSDEREIVELMAKNQYERSLYEARSHRPPGGNNNNWITPNTSSGFPKASMNEVCLHQEYLSMIRPSSSIANISMMPTSASMGPTAIRNPAAGFFHHRDQVSSFSMFDAFSQKQPSSGVWISNSGPQRHHDPCYHHHASKENKNLADTHLYATTNKQVLEAFSPYRNGTSMPFGQEYAKCSEKDKGKSIMDLDLNLVAPNVVEEQNNLGSLDLTSNTKHISSLDSSYSNEAIPAMQLLSLMDAGKSNHPFTDNKKFTKPLSPCYTHCSSTMAGKTSPMDNSCFPYSGLKPGVQKPIGSSSHFRSVPNGSSLAAGGFRSDQDFKLPSINGHHQVYHKPQEEKSRGTYSASLSHGFRPEERPFAQDRSERASLGAHRIDPPRTTICTINQNPADFSTPGPENEYMINSEDLKLRGEGSYKRKSGLENPNGSKRQKRS